jgi:hypothetical protein
MQVTDRLSPVHNGPVDITLTDAIPKLLHNSYLSDVKFHVKGFDFYAHRLILEIRCPHMQQYLASRDVYRSDKLDPIAFFSLLSYIYRSQFILNEHNMVAIYKCAHFFGLPEVQRAAFTLITGENVLKWVEVAIREDMDLMYETCIQLIAKELESLVQRSEWLSVPRRVVKRVTVEDELNISEVALFEAVVRWAQAQVLRKEGSSLKDMAGDIVYNIRFMNMDKSEGQSICNKMRTLKLMDAEDLIDLMCLLSQDNLPDKFDKRKRSRVFC